MTPAEQQAAALAKLLKNPDKPIVIPDRPREGASKTLRAPREMMKNVQGSSAGAGSGEFVSLNQQFISCFSLADNDPLSVAHYISLPFYLHFARSFQTQCAYLLIQ